VLAPLRAALLGAERELGIADEQRAHECGDSADDHAPRNAVSDGAGEFVEL
jgi:hypothetical protein